MNTDKAPTSAFGFDTSFLGAPIEPPVLNVEQQTDSVIVDGSAVISITRISP